MLTKEALRLNEEQDPDMDPHLCEKSDPNPHQSEESDLDPQSKHYARQILHQLQPQILKYQP